MFHPKTNIIVKMITQEDMVEDFNPKEHRIFQPLSEAIEKDMLEAYRRDIARQVAVKIACGDYTSEEVGTYAVGVANEVIKHLKETSI